MPNVVRRINNALLRADEISRVEGDTSVEDWLLPIVADGEAGFGGALNVYELQKAMIAAGAAGTHWEDQLASEKKCGHLGGKVLIPTQQHIRTLTSARLAADVANTPTVVIARTDAEAATLITSDVDDRDKPFITGERTAEGFYKIKNGLEPCIARAKSYAPYADMIWMETGTPDLELAKKFADGVHEEFPDQLLSSNCSPSFNWSAHLDADDRQVPEGAGRDGLPSSSSPWPASTLSTTAWSTWPRLRSRGMTAFVDLQNREFKAAEERGFTAVKHSVVGAGYFDTIAT